jgi:RimJ/RimL family protein N-acetyltransferase
MLSRLWQNTPAFRHQEFKPPQSWYGALDAKGVVAALGFNNYLDGTVEIRYAVARPSRLGSWMLKRLCELIDEALPGRVIFFVDAKNRRMQRIVEALGATRQAYLYERAAREGG